MRKILKILLTAWLAVLIACNDDDDNMVLNIVNSTVDFPATGGTGTITFSASGDITATSDKEWLTIITSGITASTIPFVVTSSDNMMSRTAEIVVTGGMKVETIHVVQAGASFSIDTGEVIIGPFVEQTLIGFSSTAEPAVTVADDWLQGVIREGKLVLLPQLNITGVRSTVVTVSTPWKSVTLTITQKPFIAGQSELTVYRSGQGSSGVITLSECPDELTGQWEAVTDADWLTLTVENNLAVVVAGENTSGGMRSGSVHLTLNGGIVETVTVNQEMYSYEYFLGDWNLRYYDSEGLQTLPILLTEKEYGVNYTVTGLIAGSDFAYDVKAGYDPVTGNLSILSQYVGVYNNGSVVYLCPWNPDNGAFVWEPAAGFNLIYNRHETEPGFTFSDNGAMTGLTFSSYIVVAFTGIPGEDTLAGALQQLLFPQSLSRPLTWTGLSLNSK